MATIIKLEKQQIFLYSSEILKPLLTLSKQDAVLIGKQPSSNINPMFDLLPEYSFAYFLHPIISVVWN